VKIWVRITNYPKISLVILAYVAFIALGMPDGLLGVAWPSIRASFSIPLDAIGMLLTAAVAGYMTSSFLSGTLDARFGIGRVLIVSCALTGTAILVYTLVPAWWMMVVLGTFTGLGAGAIDAGLNSYVAAHFGEGLMQWLHASYGVGVTLGPIIMTIALTTLNSWRIGYRVVGGFQIALAACFVFTLAKWSQKEPNVGSDESKLLTEYKTPIRETLRQPQVWLSVLLFFCTWVPKYQSECGLIVCWLSHAALTRLRPDFLLVVIGQHLPLAGWLRDCLQSEWALILWFRVV